MHFLMKILVVVAHKASGRGELLTKRYVKHIREAFAACEHFHEKLDIQVRNHSQLSDFIPPAARETDVPDIVKVRDRLTAFDGIDFVFIDGDDNLLPWSRPAAPLLQLLHLCMSSGKIVFGSGCAVALLAYLASVGPVSVPVLNGGGKGGTLRSFGSEGLAVFVGGDSSGGNGRAGAGAGSSSTASLNASDGPMSQPGGMLLEKQTGDLFRFDDVRRAWMPVGNVGVHCSLGAISGRPDAQVGTGLNRSDGIGPCELTQAARFHPLFHGVWPAKLLVPEANEWHCHLPPFDAAVQVPTGIFGVSVLATSRLGAQVIECRNAVAVQFRSDDRFPQTVRMLHNFVSHKLQLIIGEGEGEMPKRLLEMAARETQHSDLVQQILRSLAPPSTGPFAMAADYGIDQRAAAPAPAPAASSAGSLLASKALGQAGATAAASRLRPGSASSVRSAAGAPAYTPVRSQSAHLIKSHGARPGSAGSSRGPATVPPRGSSAAPTTSAYAIRPSAALTYVNASRDALTAHAEQGHIGKETKAFVEMPGVASDVPLYATRAPVPTYEAGLKAQQQQQQRAASVNILGGGRGAGGAGGSDAELVPRIFAEDLILEPLEGEEEARAAARRGAAAAQAARPPPVNPRPRTVRVRRSSGKPFSNYQKYDAMRTALRDHSIHITSVGPYISKLEQKNFDEQDARAKSIHPAVFKPGGLWDKWEAPPGGWGFAAAGFLLPDDLPETSKRFGSFYNTHAHQFRHTAPKKNLYM